MKIINRLCIICSLSLLLSSILRAESVKERDFTVKVTVPDMGWKIKITNVYQVGGEVWVVAQLDRPPVMAGQMITTVAATVRVTAPELPVKYFVLGKKWNWENSEPYTFLKSRKQIENDLKTGRLLYPQP